MPRVLLLVFVLVSMLAGGHRAYGDDDPLASAREDARRQLVEEANRALRSDGTAALLAMVRSLEADRAFADAYTPTDDADRERLAAFRSTLAERELLLGPGAEGSPPPPEGVSAAEHARATRRGAIWAATRLQAWLVGEYPCEVVLTDLQPEGANPKTYAFSLAQARREAQAAAARAKAEAEKTAAAKAEAEKAAKAAPASGDGAGQGVPKGDAPKEAPPAAATPSANGGGESAADAPSTTEDFIRVWIRRVRAEEGGSIVDRRIRPEPCPDIAALLQAAERDPVYVHESLRGLKRFAVVPEATFDYNLPSAMLRATQARERSLRMQADRPQPALVDGAMVREKSEVVRKLTESSERVDRMRAELARTLDAMVLELDAWKTQAALLATEIEELRRTLGTDKADGLDPQEAAAREAASLPLRLAQARETLATLEIGLLLNTAARLGTRDDLLDRVQQAASQELREAEELRARYEEALLRLRTARRIDRIDRDSRRLQLWRAQAPREATGRPLERQVAYAALLEVHEVVREAVTRRRAMAAGSAREAEGGSRPLDADDVSRRVTAETEAERVAGPRLSLSVAAPQTAAWDRKFIELAERELADPALRHRFDAQLVARHYAEASDEVARLLRAERATRDLPALRARFMAADAAARAALEPLATDPLAVQVRRLPAMRAAAVDDFEAALQGIAEQQERNRGRMRAIVAYQQRLTRQGTRSLLIRVDRTQRDAYLGDVLDDTRAAFESVGAWASFRGERHAGDWLRDAWPKLLLVLGALAIVLVGARFLRRRVDARIDRMVASIPEVGASVREERERAKRRRERSDEAAHAITDDDVIKVPTEATVSMPVEQPPDGGNGGTAPDPDPDPRTGDRS